MPLILAGTIGSNAIAACLLMLSRLSCTYKLNSPFELIEEFDETVDLTLGSPGPLIHALEHTTPKYEEYLLSSLSRKPTTTGVWMAERIYRTPDNDKEFWAEKIKDVMNHPDASDQIKRSIEYLL